MTAGIRSNGFTNKPHDPYYSVGKQLLTTRYTKTIVTGEGTNRLHILAGPLSLDQRIVGLIGATPALTSATNNDLGFWKMDPDGGFTALDQDILLDGVTLASALTYRELITSFSPTLDLTKNIGEHLGLSSDQQPAGGVYLGLYIQTASTATSEVLNLDVVIEQATTK